MKINGRKTDFITVKHTGLKYGYSTALSNFDAEAAFISIEVNDLCELEELIYILEDTKKHFRKQCVHYRREKK